jgi:hypothetical protein
MSGAVPLLPLRAFTAWIGKLPFFYLGFKESRIRECVKRDALFRNRAKFDVVSAMWLWFVENHARYCYVMMRVLLLVGVSPRLLSSRLLRVTQAC